MPPAAPLPMPTIYGDPPPCWQSGDHLTQTLRCRSAWQPAHHASALGAGAAHHSFTLLNIR